MLERDIADGVLGNFHGRMGWFGSSPLNEIRNGFDQKNETAIMLEIMSRLYPKSSGQLSGRSEIKFIPVLQSFHFH